MAADTTSPPTLPPIHDLPSLDVNRRAQVLDLLFEPCVPLHTLALPLLSLSGAQTFAPASTLHHESFPSYKSLIDAVGAQMRALADSTSTSDKEWLDGILSAHPRLGEKKVDSALSRMEQAAMNAASTSSGTGGSSQSTEEEAAMLKQLNAEYEKTFPGLRYVVFVNGRARSVIMDEMRSRIARADIHAERLEATQAMCDIALDRAKKLGAD